MTRRAANGRRPCLPTPKPRFQFRLSFSFRFRSVQPEDWEDEEDGEWEAPMIPNPDYQGPWTPKRVKNPEYKGAWAAPLIDNPGEYNFVLSFRISDLLGKKRSWVFGSCMFFQRKGSALVRVRILLRQSFFNLLHLGRRCFQGQRRSKLLTSSI